MAFCIKCGAALEEGARFCMMCGTPSETPAQMATPIMNPEPAPVMETPVMETPVMETPVMEVPVMETPVMEVPVMETPVMETPVMETPVMETPVMEAPVMETPVMETPVMEAPVIEAPIMETPVMETPIMETPIMEAPVIEEPVGMVSLSNGEQPQGGFVPQPEMPQGSFVPQPEMPQGSFVPQPEVPQGGFVPQPEQPQGGFVPQPEVPQGGFVPQPEIPQGGFVPQPEMPQGGFVPQPTAPQQSYSASAVPVSGTTNGTTNGQRKKKKGPVIALISIGLLAIAAIVIAVILIFGSKTAEIDLSNYVVIECDGYDTEGTAYVYVDEEKLLVDILKAQGEDATATNKVSFSMKALINSVKVEQKEYTDLSNEQKISITVKFDKLLMEENDVEFKNATNEYTIKGLKELIAIDPFEYVTLEFNGISPNGYVYYDIESDIDCVKWAAMEFNKDQKLKNGDTITLRVKQIAIDNAVDNGYKFTVTSKDYKVEGLDFYYSSLDEISDEHMKIYDQVAKETFDDAISWVSSIQYSDVKVIGKYFATSSVYPSNNMIIYVYTATATSPEGNFDPTTIYMPVYMKVTCVEDGKLGNVWGSTDGFMSAEVGYCSAYGYVSGDLMYTEYIVKNLKDNNYEVVASKDMPPFKELEGDVKNELPAPGQTGGETETPTGEDASTELPTDGSEEETTSTSEEETSGENNN